MKLYPKMLVFSLALIGLSLWTGMHFYRKAVWSALSEQIADAAYSTAAENPAGFQKALVSRKETDGISALYDYKRRSGAIYAGLLDLDRRIVAHTNVSLTGSVTDLAGFRTIQTRAPSFRRTFYKGEDILEVLIPVKAASRPSAESALLDGEEKRAAGFVWAGLSLNPARKAEKDIFVNLLFTTLGISLASLILTALFVRRILKQVKALYEGIRKTRYGDLDWEVKVESSDEIGDLTAFFNGMLKDLKKSKTIIEGYQANLEQKVEERTAELKKSQEHLLQASRMAAVGQLISGVAHELNNPLAGIMGYTQLMLKDKDLTAQQREDLGIILSQSGRCKDIIENLLQFSRKKEPKKESINIPNLIAGTLKLMNYEFTTSGIELVCDVPRPLPPVPGDISQLQQVLLNLLANARDAMAHAKGAKLSITARAVGEKVVLEFSDTGTGISKENLSRIFDPFFTTKPTGKGTGLGLSISYEIIKEHGGTLSATSEPGKGSTFTIELPIKK